MRLVLPLAALALLAAPAYAQTTASATSSTTSSVLAAPQPTPPRPSPHHRLTMAERFAEANTTHDGHLTLEQAKAGYETVARHFAAIDVTNRGFITEEDIKAFDKAEREKHHAKKEVHLTMAERFAKANTTHDGHLTLAQAKTGYVAVARHFTEIDATNRGFITVDDIHAWEKAQREKRHAKKQEEKAASKG